MGVVHQVQIHLCLLKSLCRLFSWLPLASEIVLLDPILSLLVVLGRAGSLRERAQ